MSKLKGIIFDMDGVLIDSTPLIWASFNKVLSEDYGFTISDKDIKQYVGRALSSQIKMWEEDYNIKGGIDFESFSSKASSIRRKLMKEKLVPNETAKRIINNAKEEGIKVAVATSSTKDRALNILNKLEISPLLDAVVTADDIEKHKPDPEGFLDAAGKININPEYCVVIEDAVNGIEAAKRAGMKSAAIVTKFHTAEELKDADLVVRSLSEISVEKLKDLFVFKENS